MIELGVVPSIKMCGSFVTKVRSRLEDDTIDALVYLKKYYIRQKDEDISALFLKN